MCHFSIKHIFLCTHKILGFARKIIFGCSFVSRKNTILRIVIPGAKCFVFAFYIRSYWYLADARIRTFIKEGSWYVFIWTPYFFIPVVYDADGLREIRKSWFGCFFHCGSDNADLGDFLLQVIVKKIYKSHVNLTEYLQVPE